MLIIAGSSDNKANKTIAEAKALHEDFNKYLNMI